MWQSTDSWARRSRDTNPKSLEYKMNQPPGISAPEKGDSLTSSSSPVSRRPTISSAPDFPLPSKPIQEILKPTSLSDRHQLMGGFYVKLPRSLSATESSRRRTCKRAL